VDTLVALGLGIVIHSIHQFVRAELGGDATSHQVWKLLDGRGRVGSGRAEWVMMEWGGGEHCLRGGLVAVGLCRHTQYCCSGSNRG
jgi:hypothetical protein